MYCGRMGLQKGYQVRLQTFGIVFNMFCSLWQKLDFEIEQRLFMSPTGLEYAIIVLLTNCYNCVYPSQVSKHFELDPPTIEEYLQNIN